MPSTNRHRASERIELKEFAGRRSRLRAALKNAVALLFAGDHDAHSDAIFRPHRHFEYLTGVTDEPGAALLIDPSNPVEARREMLFLRPLNPEIEKWDGLRLEITAALREKTGFNTVFRLDKLGLWLNDAARRSKTLACLHPPAQYSQPISPDLAIFRKVAERIPGVTIEDRSDEIPVMRSSKSKGEIAMLEHAIEITAHGFKQVMRAINPGINEFDVQETIEHAYRTSGARSLSFPSITGAGINSTVLHYRANDQQLEDGDLICIDSGAKWQGYSADITRTFPVNGKFTKRQREVYDVVLAAQLAAIKAVRAGARISQIDAAARKVINGAGLGDYFIHGIGHHLGLDTHDATPSGDRPLRPGAVITIEPGVYIPDEKLGIRIEDDVVVTQAGARVLSEMIPKRAQDVERAMRSR
jgi:Xaa-Pro aminopeptidase